MCNRTQYEYHHYPSVPHTDCRLGISPTPVVARVGSCDRSSQFSNMVSISSPEGVQPFYHDTHHNQTPINTIFASSVWLSGDIRGTSPGFLCGYGSWGHSGRCCLEVKNIALSRQCLFHFGALHAELVIHVPGKNFTRADVG